MFSQSRFSWTTAEIMVNDVQIITAPYETSDMIIISAWFLINDDVSKRSIWAYFTNGPGDMIKHTNSSLDYLEFYSEIGVEKGVLTSSLKHTTYYSMYKSETVI